MLFGKHNKLNNYKYKSMVYRDEMKIEKSFNHNSLEFIMNQKVFLIQM